MPCLAESNMMPVPTIISHWPHASIDAELGEERVEVVAQTACFPGNGPEFDLQDTFQYLSFPICQKGAIIYL